MYEESGCQHLRKFGDTRWRTAKVLSYIQIPPMPSNMTPSSRHHEFHQDLRCRVILPGCVVLQSSKGVLLTLRGFVLTVAVPWPTHASLVRALAPIPRGLYQKRDTRLSRRRSQTRAHCRSPPPVSPPLRLDANSDVQLVRVCIDCSLADAVSPFFAWKVRRMVQFDDVLKSYRPFWCEHSLEGIISRGDPSTRACRFPWSKRQRQGYVTNTGK